MAYPLVIDLIAICLLFATRWLPLDQFFFPAASGIDSTKIIETVVRAFATLAILSASLYVILSGKYDDATSKWAFGAVGLVIGTLVPAKSK